MGTLPYTALEQFKRNKALRESDVYSLAILLHEALDCTQPQMVTSLSDARALMKDGHRSDLEELEDRAEEEGLEGLVALVQRMWVAKPKK